MDFKTIKKFVEDIRFIITAFLTLLALLGYTVNDNIDKTELTDAMKNQIEVLIDYKKPIAQTGCDKCLKLLNEHTSKNHQYD